MFSHIKLYNFFIIYLKIFFKLKNSIKNTMLPNNNYKLKISKTGKFLRELQVQHTL